MVREKMGREGRVGSDSGGGGQRCWGSARVRGRFDEALDRSYLDPIHTLSGWVGETVERQDVELLGVLRMLLLENSFLEDGAHLGEKRQGEGEGERVEKRERGERRRKREQRVTE